MSLNTSLLSTLDPNGLDLQAAKTWIYPTNYPVRDYQLNIVQKALFNNTLVSLPTGLGKTFIAAVVMYNFFRWYPTGKLIFMAPTRPLVKQQIDACYEIMGIPKQATIELTGYTKMASTTTRSDVWSDKRVFFITPQILQNDLDTIVELASKIKCLVFDEAHRARGNYAYCIVIQKLLKSNKFFRVLALSATPGKTVDDVQDVIRNLLISHLEFRVEESLDVRQYVFQRVLETIVVPLCEKIREIRDEFINVLEFYTKPLVQYKVLQGNCNSLTRGKIYMTMKKFQNERKGNTISHYSEIMTNLNICITLYHAYELLIRHGLRSFLTFFDIHISKPLLKGNDYIKRIMENVRDYLGPSPNVDPLPDGSYPELSKDVKFGHPKYYKLHDILVSHFRQSDDHSRVIVFFEYRESVIEAHALLLHTKPLIRPKIFLGQKLGVTQRTQINVVKAFREGTCNTLLSTCIGEEGLDVGDVDLIVCFDISTKSPIRMVQRMGRTGRKRAGKVIALVTEGKEQQTLKDCLMHKNNIAHHVLTSNELKQEMYKDCPRMIPNDIQPVCNKLHITVDKVVNKKSSNLKDMFQKISSNNNAINQDLQISGFSNRIATNEMVWNKDLTKVNIVNSINVEKQRVLQTTYKLNHSKNTEILVDLLQLADSKRFNIPTTQRFKDKLPFSDNLKQTDIRNMFLSKPNQGCTQTIQNKQSLEEENLSLSKEFFSELLNFVSIQSYNKGECKYCPFDCNIEFKSNEKPIDVQKWSVDSEILSNITASDLIAFRKQISPEEYVSSIDEEMNTFDKSLNEDLDLFNDSKLDAIVNYFETTVQNEKLEENNPERTCVFFEDDVVKNETNNVSFFEAPQNFQSIIQQEEECKENDLLSFFHLESIEDIFEDDLDKTILINDSPDIVNNKNVQSFSSPCLFDSESDEVCQSPDSPILCSLEHRVQNIKRNLTNSLKSPENNHSMRNNTKLSLNKKHCDNENNISKNVESEDELVISSSLCDISDICDLSEFGINLSFGQDKINKKNSDTLKSPKSIKTNNDIKLNLKNTQCSRVTEANVEEKSVNLNISDICDLSELGINLTQNKEPKQTTQKNMAIDEICDLSSFGITESQNKMNKDNVADNQKISQSQINVTQLISLINKPQEKSTKKLSDDEDFDLNLTNAIKKSTQKYIECNFKKPSTSVKPKTPLRTSNNREIEKKSKQIHKKPTKKLKLNQFLDDEAGVSENDDVFMSQDEPEENLDCYETSFVADETTVCDSTQMMGKYLQSIKSPPRPGMFKIPTMPRKEVSFIYSQPDDKIENDTYLDDSFVVHEDDENLSFVHEMSELEILEEKLKKRKQSTSVSTKGTKRKRILTVIDSSEESD